MGKKTIVGFLIGLALAYIHPAGAQQPTAMIPKIGFLSSGTASGSTSTLRNEAFWQQLRKLGYIEGKNISLVAR